MQRLNFSVRCSCGGGGDCTYLFALLGRRPWGPATAAAEMSPPGLVRPGEVNPFCQTSKILLRRTTLVENAALWSGRPGKRQSVDAGQHTAPPRGR